MLGDLRVDKTRWTVAGPASFGAGVAEEPPAGDSAEAGPTGRRRGPLGPAASLWLASLDDPRRVTVLRRRGTRRCADAPLCIFLGRRTSRPPGSGGTAGGAGRGGRAHLAPQLLGGYLARWPYAGGVVIGLAWWLWLWPGAVGLLIAFVAAAAARDQLAQSPRRAVSQSAGVGTLSGKCGPPRGLCPSGRCTLGRSRLALFAQSVPATEGHFRTLVVAEVGRAFVVAGEGWVRDMPQMAGGCGQHDRPESQAEPAEPQLEVPIFQPQPTKFSSKPLTRSEVVAPQGDVGAGQTRPHGNPQQRRDASADALLGQPSLLAREIHCRYPPLWTTVSVTRCDAAMSSR